MLTLIVAGCSLNQAAGTKSTLSSFGTKQPLARPVGLRALSIDKHPGMSDVAEIAGAFAGLSKQQAGLAIGPAACEACDD